MTDDVACDLCGDDDGGYCSADVGGVDEHGQPMQIHVDTCEGCAPRLLFTVLKKVPDGAALVLKKQRGKLKLVWDQGDAPPPRRSQIGELVWGRLKRARMRWQAWGAADGRSKG